MHASTLRNIRQAPHDDRLRRDVATWLRARGRSASATWVEAELAAAAHPNDLGLREAFHRARASADPSVVLTMEQPGLLRVTGLPLPALWIGLGLGQARPSRGTFDRYDYATLPTLPIQVDWRWIEHGPAATLVNGSLSRHIAAVERRVANAGYVLPAAFRQLFDRYVGQRRIIRSCTGARFVLDPALWTPAEVHGGLLVPFYLDGETALGWGLWLHPSGSEAVLAFPLAPTMGVPAGPPRISRDHRVLDLAWVAPSLTSFVYRFALENDVWFAQHGRAGAASLDTHTYLEHYRKPLNGPRAGG